MLAAASCAAAALLVVRTAVGAAAACRRELRWLCRLGMLSMRGGLAWLRNQIVCKEQRQFAAAAATEWLALGGRMGNAAAAAGVLFQDKRCWGWQVTSGCLLKQQQQQQRELLQVLGIVRSGTRCLLTVRGAHMVLWHHVGDVVMWQTAAEAAGLMYCCLCMACRLISMLHFVLPTGVHATSKQDVAGQQCSLQRLVSKHKG